MHSKHSFWSGVNPLIHRFVFDGGLKWRILMAWWEIVENSQNSPEMIPVTS